VRRAYKRLALVHHPDKACAAAGAPKPSLTGAFASDASAIEARLRASADETFKRIQEAKEALASAVGRARVRAALAREAFLFRERNSGGGGGGARLGLLLSCEQSRHRLRAWLPWPTAHLEAQVLQLRRLLVAHLGISSITCHT
jgi:hypothetical protein